MGLLGTGTPAAAGTAFENIDGRGDIASSQLLPVRAKPGRSSTALFRRADDEIALYIYIPPAPWATGGLGVVSIK